MLDHAQVHADAFKQWWLLLIRPPDDSREGLNFYSWTFFLYFFNQCTVLSSRAAVDVHQMYLGGSVV